MESYKVMSLDATQAGYHRALGKLRRHFLGSPRKSLDLHLGTEEKEGLRNTKTTGPMGRDASYPRVAASRSGTRLELLGFRLKLLLSKVLGFFAHLVQMIMSAISWLIIHRTLYVVTHSQNNGSYQQIQSPKTLLPRILDPISPTTTRLVPAPAVSVGSQVEKDHDKLTSGQQTGRGAVLGVTNTGKSAAALSLGGATLPGSSLAGPAFAGQPTNKI